MGIRIIDVVRSRQGFEKARCYGTFQGHISLLQSQEVKQPDGSWERKVVVEAIHKVYSDSKYQDLEPLKEEVVRLELPSEPATWRLSLRQLMGRLYGEIQERYNEVERDQDDDPDDEAEDPIDVVLPAKRARVDPGPGPTPMEVP